MNGHCRFWWIFPKDSKFGETNTTITFPPNWNPNIGKMTNWSLKHLCRGGFHSFLQSKFVEYISLEVELSYLFLFPSKLFEISRTSQFVLQKSLNSFLIQLSTSSSDTLLSHMQLKGTKEFSSCCLLDVEFEPIPLKSFEFHEAQELWGSTPEHSAYILAGGGSKREVKIERLTFCKPPFLKLPRSKKMCHYDHSETKCINPQKRHLKGFPQPINPSALKTHLIDLKVVPKFWVCHSILDRFKANLSDPICYLTPLLPHHWTEGFSILSSKKQNQRRWRPFFELWRKFPGSNNPSRMHSMCNHVIRCKRIALKTNPTSSKLKNIMVSFTSLNF